MCSWIKYENKKEGRKFGWWSWLYVVWGVFIIRVVRLLAFLLILLACLSHKERGEMTTRAMRTCRCMHVDVPWHKREIWLRLLISHLVSRSFSHFYRNSNRFWIWKLFGTTANRPSSDAHCLRQPEVHFLDAERLLGEVVQDRLESRSRNPTHWGQESSEHN